MRYPKSSSKPVTGQRPEFSFLSPNAKHGTWQHSSRSGKVKWLVVKRRRLYTWQMGHQVRINFGAPTPHLSVGMRDHSRTVSWNLHTQFISKHILYGIFIVLLYYKNKTSHHRKNLKRRKKILEIIHLSLYHQLIFTKHTHPAVSNSINTHAELWKDTH